MRVRSAYCSLCCVSRSFASAQIQTFVWRREFRLTGSVVGGMQGMSLALRPVLQTSPAGCRAACTAGCSLTPGRSPGSQRLIPARYQAIPPASVHRRIQPRTFGPRRQNSIWCANSRSTQRPFTQCSLQLYVTTCSGTVVVVPIYWPVPVARVLPLNFDITGYSSSEYKGHGRVTNCHA